MDEAKIKSIIKSNIVEPILAVRKRHPNMLITEKGFDILIDNIIEEFKKTRSLFWEE